MIRMIALSSGAFVLGVCTIVWAQVSGAAPSPSDTGALEIGGGALGGGISAIGMYKLLELWLKSKRQESLTVLHQILEAVKESSTVLHQILEAVKETRREQKSIAEDHARDHRTHDDAHARLERNLERVAKED